MKPTAQLAGFFAAHGVWCVSDGGPLTPMLAYELADGSRQMSRFAADTLEKGVELGRKQLAENAHLALRAAFVFDGYLNLESGKTDALFIEARNYADDVAFVMAVPYRQSEDPAGFAVFRPKFIDFEGPKPDYGALAEDFFAGIEQHEKGAEIWDRYLDESL